MSKQVTVSVPATTANLGAGYDALGIALELRDLVSAQFNQSGEIKVSVSGMGSNNLPNNQNHLIAKTIIDTAKKFGKVTSGLIINCQNAIPQGRGLGSSAAAIVAGMLLTRELLEEESIDDNFIIQSASQIEGHPDNVSSCLMGGLTISWKTPNEEYNTRSLNVNPAIIPVVGVPDTQLSTKTARGLIPSLIPHNDAVFNSARTALLVAALVADTSSLFDATDDKLHQPYRRSAYLESMQLVDLLRANNIAACISGAGPTVLALCTANNVESAMNSMNNYEFPALSLKVADPGAFVVN